MLVELYIKALLVDEDLADQVWELWDRELVTDTSAYLLWNLVRHSESPGRTENSGA